MSYRGACFLAFGKIPKGTEVWGRHRWDSETNHSNLPPSCPIRVPRPGRSSTKDQFLMVPNPRPPQGGCFSVVGVEKLATWKFVSTTVKHVPIFTHIWRVLAPRPSRTWPLHRDHQSRCNSAGEDESNRACAWASSSNRTSIGVTAVTPRQSDIHNGTSART